MKQFFPDDIASTLSRISGAILTLGGTEYGQALKEQQLNKQQSELNKLGSILNNSNIPQFAYNAYTPEQLQKNQLAALMQINNPSAQAIGKDIFSAQLPTPERNVNQQKANIEQQQANTQAMDIKSLMKYRAQSAATAQQQADVEHFKAHNTLPGFENVGNGKLMPNIIVPNPAQQVPPPSTAPLSGQQSPDPMAAGQAPTQLKPGVNAPNPMGAQQIPNHILYPVEYNKMETDLRKEYLENPQVKGLQERTEGYNTFLSTIHDKGGANDLSSMLAFIKMAAPGQAVRQNELQALGDSMGLGDRLDVTMQKLRQGGKLSDNQRNMYIQAANKIYNSAAQQNLKIKGQYATLAQQKGLNPNNVILDVTSNKEGSAPSQGTASVAPAQSPNSTAKPVTIINPKTGHRMQLINGQWR